MIIGIPKEIKNNENRVGITPTGAELLIHHGHTVILEANAGTSAGFPDEVYEEVGVQIKAQADIWAADMVIKVKEPQEEEYKFFREGLILFTYLHLANEPTLTQVLADAKVTAVAYETMVDEEGKLPLLTPMSVIAGRLSIQIAANYLQSQYGGSGILLAGTPGVASGKVVIIGGGVTGSNALQIAKGMGADCTVLDVQPGVLAEIEKQYGTDVRTLMSNPVNIAEELKDADVVIGAVLIPGRKAPTLVTEEMVKEMKPGSVIVDIAIDQGGIFETEDRLTNHDNPTYEKYGVLHYAVPNMPGAVSKTSTQALANSTMPYAVDIADKGIKEAAKENNTILTGINVMAGKVTNLDVAESLDLEYTPVDQVL